MAEDPRAKLKKAAKSPEPIPEDTRKLHAAREELKQLRSSQKALLRQLGESEERFDTLAAIKAPQKVAKFRSRPASKGTHVAVTGSIASDWHVGEHVSLGQTNGLNSYSPKIATKRMGEYFERTLWLVNQMRSGMTVETHVLALLGDLMTGFIHEDLRQTNTMSPTQEVRFVRKALIAGIDYWLEKGDFRDILVPCIWGNHGRINYDRQLIHAGMTNSYEAMLYWDLQDHYADEERLSFNVSEGPLVYQSVDGYMIRCTHGNGWGYGGGIGGVTIPMNRWIGHQDKGITADLTLAGHWHTYLDLGRALVNGALKGVDAFSMDKGFEPEPPQQGFFAFSPKDRRRLLAAPIFCEDPGIWNRRRKGGGK